VGISVSLMQRLVCVCLGDCQMVISANNMLSVSVLKERVIRRLGLTHVNVRMSHYHFCQLGAAYIQTLI
jgi:hypothetical protein